MGSAGESRYHIAKSIIVRSYAYGLLDLSIPNHFLGIDGHLRKNTLALKLGAGIYENLITVDEAVVELKEFNEKIIREKTVQLPLWSQSKLDRMLKE